MGLLALGAGRVRIQAQHLTCMLFALDETDGILSGWDAGIGVFEGVANTDAVDGKVAVGVLTLGLGSSQKNSHNFHKLHVNS